MDQRFPRGNRLAHTTVAMFQASDPRDKPSEKALAQYNPPHSLHPHSSRSENSETSDKKVSKEKKQRRLGYERVQNESGSTPATDVNAPNVTSTFGRACKDLSQITSYNYDKKGLPEELFRTQERRLRRLVTVSTTSALMTGAPCYPDTRFLHSIPGLSPKISRRSHVGHDGHSRFFALGQAGKVQTYGLQRGSSSGRRTRLPTAKWAEYAKEFAAAALGDNDKSLCGSVSKAKNVHPFRQAQIASLDVEKVPVTILAVFGLHRRLLCTLHRGVTRAHRHQRLSY